MHAGPNLRESGPAVFQPRSQGLTMDSSDRSYSDVRFMLSSNEGRTPECRSLCIELENESFQTQLSRHTAVSAVPRSRWYPASSTPILVTSRHRSVKVSALEDGRTLEYCTRRLLQRSTMPSWLSVDAEKGVGERKEEEATGQAIEKGEQGSAADVLEPRRDLTNRDVVTRCE